MKLMTVEKLFEKSFPLLLLILKQGFFRSQKPCFFIYSSFILIIITKTMNSTKSLKVFLQVEMFFHNILPNHLTNLKRGNFQLTNCRKILLLSIIKFWILLLNSIFQQISKGINDSKTILPLLFSY